MRNNRPIGIFDSGVGGLSIYQEVKKLLPNESFVYFADQANNPYGGRSKAEIEKLSSSVVTFLLKKNVKLVIVACNTATVSSIDYLRNRFKIPIIGVVPVVKRIAKETKTGRIAVFSTPATAKSEYLSNLISKFAKSKLVHKVGTSGLEHLIEKGIVSGNEIRNVLKNALFPLISDNVDVIALGCTHYPFIKSEIEKVVGSKIRIFDSGEAIARRTKFVLENEKLEAKKGQKDLFFTSGDLKNFKKVAEKLINVRLDQVYKAEL